MKTALITGATSGIGRETALALARHGFQVVIIGRRPSETAKTAEWIGTQTGNRNVEYLVADLTAQVDVRRVAHEFSATHRRLDVLINNAGAVFPKWELTDEGIERTWALNHLAPVLLSLELLGSLKASAPSRIVNVASSAQSNGRIDLGSRNAQASFSMNAYSNAKLANVMATYALARRLHGTGVTVNCLHPGVVATSFGKNTGGWIKSLSTLAGPFLMTPERGAATSVYVASAPEVETTTGCYFVKAKPSKSSATSYDEGLQEQVWQRALREVRAKDVPGI
ncbi:SDR family oxidoreductase [Glaciibacter sp. 2TAF33]|uniref:SDR family oxidoreductase n=1 Tax=Glaciibacter sp. 2TAF33 TaxID=3233015 RepID=UPI003F900CFB